jgi:hypothetical protein
VIVEGAGPQKTVALIEEVEREVNAKQRWQVRGSFGQRKEYK